MSDFGYQSNIAQVGNSRQLIASDFENVRWKPVGITLDWATVAAVAGADVVLPGGTTVKIGQKYIPAGTIVTKITASGKYGPCETGAADGRQLVTRSEIFLLNEDVTQNAPIGLLQGNASDHPAVFDGGTIWKARLLVGGAGQLTLANFLLAFPMIDFAAA